jgi:hypothetical protein
VAKILNVVPRVKCPVSKGNPGYGYSVGPLAGSSILSPRISFSLLDRSPATTAGARAQSLRTHADMAPTDFGV